jgi:hypothetical protein
VPEITAFLVAAGIAGCDPLVTSVGSWQPDAGHASLESGSFNDGGPSDVVYDGPLSGPTFYIEAELGRLDGFTVGDDATASGGHYLLAPVGLISEDQPGSATARYDLAIGTAGDYLLWARFRTPDWQHNRIWASLDGETPIKWRSTTGDIWYWYFLHPDLDYVTAVVFKGLSVGHHELVLSNCTDGVQIDRLYVTSIGQGDRPPGDVSSCSRQPPDEIPIAGQCVPSCGALVGNSCEPDACAGKDLKQAYDCAVCCYVGD